MTWRVLPDCAAFLLEHHFRDGSTRRTIVGPRSVYADIDRTNRVCTLITRLPPGLLPFPMSEIADDAVTPDAIGPLCRRRISPLASAALALLRPTMTVERMASDLGVSSRHLRTVLLEYVGLSPKRALRVTRFHAVFAASKTDPQATWSRLAATHGYCDQSHLVDEFHALVGESPEAFRARCEREAAESVPLLPSVEPWPSIYSTHAPPPGRVDTLVPVP